MPTTLIQGGTVISAVGRREADVLIDGETIVAVLAPGQAAAMGVNPDRTIDATGKYVVPGGVDVHTHMELPFGGTEASDTFETGTIAAAWGGVTTIVDFAVQNTGFSVHDQLAVWHEKAAGNCAIDYGFHQIIGGVDEESLKAMTYLVDNEGITSFKLFMAYPGVLYSDDGQILRAMQNASDSGAMIMMHAENGIAIDVLVAQSIAAATPTRSSTRSPGPPSWSPRRPTARSSSPRSPATCRCTSCTCRRRERSRRSPPPSTPGSTCSPRRARSTCT
jgi:dihydropyrimidinase